MIVRPKLKDVEATLFGASDILKVKVTCPPSYHLQIATMNQASLSVIGVGCIEPPSVPNMEAISYRLIRWVGPEFYEIENGLGIRLGYCEYVQIK